MFFFFFNRTHDNNYGPTQCSFNFKFNLIYCTTGADSMQH